MGKPKPPTRYAGLAPSPTALKTHVGLLLGSGVPYLDTFFWCLFLSGTIMKLKSLLFLSGYFKVQLSDKALN